MDRDQPGRENFRVGQRLASQRHIGHWTVLDVRRGGFGVVYVVRSSDTGGRKVLKTYDTRLLWSDADRARFEREALTWVRLRPHPHVAPAEHVEWIEGLPCVVTEYAEGGDLAGLLAAGPLPPAGALRFARHLCDGLRHAHDQLGLVHRDVKPANCLLTGDLTLRVTDFGLARAFDTGDAGPPAAPGEPPPGTGAPHTSVAGTPHYMAPEQYVPGAPLDTRADVYAFGVVLFQMVTGELPPGGGRARAYVDRATGWRARRTRLHRLIRACTEPDRENRPPDFAAVRDLLDGAHRQVLGRPAPPPPESPVLTAEEYVSRAVGLVHLGRFDEALEEAAHGLRTAGRDGDGDVVHGKLWQVRGMALGRLRSAQDALAAYDRAVELNPDEPSAWLNRGNQLLSQQRHEDALASYDRALELRPDIGNVWGSKANALTGLGRYEDAEEAASRAVELRPRDPNILVIRALLRGRQYRHAEALADLDRALAVEPRSVDALANKGNTLLLLSRPAEALDVLRRADDLRPDDPNIWCNLTLAAYRLERYEEARDCCEKALRLAGDTAELLVHRGLLHGRLDGPGEDELACYDRAVAAADADDHWRATAWGKKGAALAALGRLQEALACYDEGLEILPDTSWLRDGRRAVAARLTP
ncbi:tetratricopeptide repeat protein [Streptomyces sp. MAR4 CNX-425]|uniref:tetratricopeptide repeat protein n=1 Tax=Streptomyces sp. MAR4 CNX-425 TaxID=3406343 RepID=UPI003B4FFCD2